MIIQSIKLQNIRSYLTETLVLPEGAVMLSGDIGSGKSTILLAVEFALFGIMRGSLDGSSLLRHGRNTGSVELSLIIDGQPVIIKRSLKRVSGEVRQDSGYVIINGIKTEGTAVELKSKTLELLGYPAELLTKSKALIYRYTVYTPQEEMKRILTDEQEVRLDILRRVFQIDKYRHIKDNSQVVSRSIKDRVKVLSAKLEGFADKQQRLAKLSQEKLQLHNKILELQPQLDELKESCLQAEAKLEELEKKRIRLLELENSVKLAEAKIQSYRDTALKADQRAKKLQTEMEILSKAVADYVIEETGLSIEELAPILASQETDYKLLLENGSAIKEKSAGLASKLSELSKQLAGRAAGEQRVIGLKDKLLSLDIAGPELDAKIKAERERLGGCDKELASCNALLTQSKELVLQVEMLDNCPMCLQSVSTEHKNNITVQEQHKTSTIQERMVNLESDRARLWGELEELIARQQASAKASLEAESIKSEMRAIERELAKAADADALGKAAEAEISQLKTQSAILTNQLAVREKELDSLRSALQKASEIEGRKRERKMLQSRIDEKQTQFAEANAEKEKADGEAANMESALAIIREQLIQLKNLADEHLAAKKAIDSLRQKLRSLELEEASIKKELETANVRIAELESELEQMRKVKAEIEYDQQLAGWLDDFFIELVASIERHVMARVHREFNEYFQTWFGLLLEDESLTVRLDDSFTPIIEQNGYETSFQSLSGGEKTSCSLAYRLALNKVINDIVSSVKTKDLIILDEPTDGFSSEQLEKVRDVIEQLGMKQVIIVSHEAKIESFVQHIIRIAKSEHTSRVVG